MTRVALPGHQTAVAHNLPVHLTSFVDRESDKRSLRELLKTSRLVTLVGAGGAGKSRLAAEVARASHDSWPDGVWWIELAAETDVAPAVVANLELPGRGAPQQVVASWLAPRRVLLILDNCEHVIAESAAFCHHMLQRCPQLTILATSREPLGVAGEVRWAVASLGDPDAITLFEARARLVAPAFRISAPNREPVVAICERLDRLPLAIEMAAARLDVMSERELLANINDRFRLLASSARNAPERQQTMVAAIDWSHRLLTAEETMLFRRLAVFQGGFTLEAARSVSSEPGGPDVLGVVTRLVQKSMVVADRLDDGSTRYRLLESHRDYAIEKLGEAGEGDATRRRHYEHFSAARWRPRDSANFWAAAGWARENAADGGIGLALEIGNSEFTDPGRAKNLLLDLLDRASPGRPEQARALNLAARLALRQGDLTTSKALADRSLQAARQAGDPHLLAQTLNGAGLVYHAAGELASSDRMYEEALSLLQQTDDTPLAIEVHNQLGILEVEQGRFEKAAERLQECVAFGRSVGNPPRLARYLESLANAQLGLESLDAAAACWTESLSLYREIHDPFGTIWCVGGLSLVSAARGDQERALRLAAIADRMSRESSLTTWAYRLNQLEAMARRARQALGERKAGGAWDDGQTMAVEHALDYALGGEQARAEAAVDAGPLSRREREVAAMVAGGMTNKEIAGRLFIAERTAEGHVERIRNKLGVRSRTEVATWAIKHGLGK